MRLRVEEWLDETGRGDVTSALRTYICSCPAHVLLSCTRAVGAQRVELWSHLHASGSRSNVVS